MWEHVFILLTDDFLVDCLKSVIPRKEKRAFIFVYFQWIWFLVVGCESTLWRCQSPKLLRFTTGSYLRPRPSLATGSNSHPNLNDVSYLQSHLKVGVTRAWKKLSSHIPFQSSSLSGDMLVMLVDRGVCTLSFSAWSDRSVEVWSVFVKLGWTKTVDTSEIWITIWYICRLLDSLCSLMISIKSTRKHSNRLLNTTAFCNPSTKFLVPFVFVEEQVLNC